jgi:hypothetical protein
VYGGMPTGCNILLNTKAACTLQALRLGTLCTDRRVLLGGKRRADSFRRVACSRLQDDASGLHDVAR